MTSSAPAISTLKALVFTSDWRQRLRIRRSLQAALVYAVCACLILFGVWTNTISQTEGVELVALIFLSCLGFYACLRSGLNLRFADPSLTLPQILAALTWSAATYGVANEAHGGVLMTLSIVLVFGVFNMNRRSAFIASVYALVAIGTVMLYKALTDPDVYRPHIQGAFFVMTVAIVPTIAGVAAALSKMRRKIREQEGHLLAAMQRFAFHGEVPENNGARATEAPNELWMQFTELARQRRDLDEKRRTMLAAISHDLRSPLARIRMAAELLPDADGVAQRREIIVRNIAVANRLLTDFIDMARADGEPIAGRVDLRTLVLELARAEPSVRVMELPNQTQWLQPASAVALERALSNLVENAKIHGAEPIEVGLRCDSATVLWVRDHGIGLPVALHAEMLKPFTRGEFSRLTPGTGLGLAIVNSATTRHGGALELKNAGPGLCVELHLPPCVADP